MIETLIAAVAAMVAWRLLREPYRRYALRNLSPNGRMVYGLLEHPSEWNLTTNYLLHKSGLSLRVGMGFWQFDIADQDYIRELPLRDCYALWPVVLALRSHLRWSGERLPAVRVCQAIRDSDIMECKRCSQRWDVNDPLPPGCKGEFR